MSDALKKSIVDAIEEGQLKLGYREETIRLYYPAVVPVHADASIHGRGGDDARADNVLRAGQRRGWARSRSTKRASGSASPIGPKEAQHGCTSTPTERGFGGFHRGNRSPRLHHGRAAGDLPAGGRHVHVEALHNGEFDWLVYFLRMESRMRIATASPTRLPPDVSSVYEKRITRRSGLKRREEGAVSGVSLDPIR